MKIWDARQEEISMRRDCDETGCGHAWKEKQTADSSVFFEDICSRQNNVIKV